MAENSGGPVIVLYGPSIQEATRSGDRTRMQEMERQAAQHLQEVESALAQLRAALQNS
ncbi:MAG TPA: DUF1843 domain-containing protein [Longimicrobium sp.]|nr:DUF1843 domain-containing protein [Longimicrobium sp.]